MVWGRQVFWSFALLYGFAGFARLKSQIASFKTGRFGDFGGNSKIFPVFLW
jgi:hypothetical protein